MSPETTLLYNPKRETDLFLLFSFFYFKREADSDVTLIAEDAIILYASCPLNRNTFPFTMNENGVCTQASYLYLKKNSWINQMTSSTMPLISVTVKAHLTLST